MGPQRNGSCEALDSSLKSPFRVLSPATVDHSGCQPAVACGKQPGLEPRGDTGRFIAFRRNQ